MQHRFLHIPMRLGIPYCALALLLSPITANALLPQAKHSVEHRQHKKEQREERRKYKEDIRQSVQELKDLADNESYPIVRAVVAKVRKSIDAYNIRYHRPVLTRSRFRDDFQRMLLIKRASSQDWDKSRHALRRYQREICAIMFPEHAKSKKYNFNAYIGENKQEDDLSPGPALARDIAYCAAGTALLYFPSTGIKNLGWGMIATGSYGAYQTTFNVIYPAVRDYRQTPATQEEREYMRELYQDRNRQCEPFYNMHLED